MTQNLIAVDNFIVDMDLLTAVPTTIVKLSIADILQSRGKVLNIVRSNYFHFHHVIWAIKTTYTLSGSNNILLLL